MNFPRCGFANRKTVSRKIEFHFLRTKFIGEYFKKIRFVGRNFSRPVSRHVASCVAPEIGRNHVQTKRIVRDATFKERRARISQFAHTNILQR